MFPFVRRRMYTSALPLIIVLLGVFLLARLTGDPTNLYLPESATPEQRDAVRRARTASTSRCGPSSSTTSRASSTSTSAPRCAPVSRRPRWRCGPSPPPSNWPSPQCFWRPSCAVIIGCWAAYRPNSLADRFSSLLSMTAASIPDFWFAITGVWLFAVLLGVLPTSGVDSGILSWILPIATLMIRPLGVLTQVVRGAMVSALSAPYVRLARSKGASDFRVVTHHALRNAAAPALTVAGDLAVGLINGAVVVEAIFGWPGIGKLMIDAILQRDFAVLQAAVLLTAVSIFVLNIIIDACYALLDARVREPVNGLRETRHMSTQLDLVPVKPTTAIVGEADTGRRKGGALEVVPDAGQRPRRRRRRRGPRPGLPHRDLRPDAGRQPGHPHRSGQLQPGAVHAGARLGQHARHRSARPQHARPADRRLPDHVVGRDPRGGHLRRRRLDDRHVGRLLPRLARDRRDARSPTSS